MRLCIAALTCLISITANSSFAQSDESRNPPPFKREPTVFIGEFEYAVSSLGKPTLGEVGGRDTLQTIATFISERQPLEPKHVQLLEEHRDDLVHLIQHETRKAESRKAEAALILMWMNMQAGTVDNELAKQFEGIEPGEFLMLHYLAMSMNLLRYETFQQVIAARRLSGYDDLRPLDSKDLELSDQYRRLFFPEPMLKLRERENWLKENLSPEARVDFKAALDVILDDTQTIQVRKSKTAVILWEMVDFPELEQEKIDMLAGARDQLVNLFKHPQAEPEIKGMLASLLVCINHRANAECAICQEAMKSLNPMELNLVMMYAPMLRMQNGKHFQQIITDKFMNCDEDTAQMIIDVIERYADAGDLDFRTALDLVARLKERPQISAPQLKQLITILVDINAREASKLGRELQERFQTRKSKEPKLDELELKREELDLKVKELESELELQIENLKRHLKLLDR